MAIKVTPVASTVNPPKVRSSLPTVDDVVICDPSPALTSLTQHHRSSASSKKRSRVQFETNVPTETSRRRKATMFAAVAARRLNARSPLSLNNEVGEEYMRRVRALFHASDADEDNAVLPNERLVLLQLMGATAMEMQTFTAMESRQPEHTVSYDAFISMYRTFIVQCAQEQRQLPPTSFVVRCKSLKVAYNRCDTDGSHEISQVELEIAFQKLGLVLSDDDLDAMRMRLDLNKDGRIEWSDFLYAAWQDFMSDSRLSSSEPHKPFFINVFAELPSSIRASADRQQRRPFQNSSKRGSLSCKGAASKDDEPKRYLSRMERIGFDFLTCVAKEHLKRVKRATLAAKMSTRFEQASHSQSTKRHVVLSSVWPAPSFMVANKRIHDLSQQLQHHEVKPPPKPIDYKNGFSQDVMRQLGHIEWTGTALGFLFGLVSGLTSMGFESQLPPRLVVDEVWGINGYVLLINIAVSLLEVIALYIMAVICAFRLTVSAGLILYPLDDEREFLARAVARAALQVSHRKDTLFGMDPMRGSPRPVLLMTSLVYRSKRYVVKFLLKLLMKRVLWRAAARATLSAAVLPLQGLFNAWTIRRVLRNCRVNIMGPPCAIAALEVFLLEDACFTPAQRVDYMRVIGCCLVCKRMVHPNVEIMVEHLRFRWLNAGSWPVKDEGCTCIHEPTERCLIHVLDDIECLISRVRFLRISTATTTSVMMTQSLLSYHLRNLFFLLIVALVIDGNLDWKERRLYVRLCEAAGVQNHWTAILALKEAFVHGRGLNAETIFTLVRFEEDVEMPIETVDTSMVPWRESVLYLGSRLAQLLSC